MDDLPEELQRFKIVMALKNANILIDTQMAPTLYS